MDSWLHPQFRCQVQFVKIIQECPICLDEIAKIPTLVMLNCGHRFCFKCASQIPVCALCRACVLPHHIVRVGGYNLLDASSFRDELWVHIDPELDLYVTITRFLWHHFGCVDTVFSKWKLCVFDPEERVPVKERGLLCYPSSVTDSVRDPFSAQYLLATIINMRGQTRRGFLHNTGASIINAILVSLGKVLLTQLEILFAIRWKITAEEVQDLLQWMFANEAFHRDCEIKDGCLCKI